MSTTSSRWSAVTAVSSPVGRLRMAVSDLLADCEERGLVVDDELLALSDGLVDQLVDELDARTL